MMIPAALFAPLSPDLALGPIAAVGLSAFDLGIVVVYLLVTVVWGAWPRKASATAEGYLLGGRNVAWPLLLLSIVATETSTVTFLSLPGQSFAKGGSCVFLQITLGYIVGRLVVIGLLLPEFFRGESFTAYGVLEQRFGPGVRRASSAVFLFCRTLADGLRLFLTGLALQQAIGWDLPSCVATITLITAIYATLGGVTSVVWNDALQLIVYTLGAVIALALILQQTPGGAAGVLEFAQSTDPPRTEVFDFRLGVFGGSMTFWSGLVGGAFLSLATHGVDHLMVQRYLCARSQRSAALALALSGPVVALQFALFLFIGIGLAAFYAASGGAADLQPDQAFAAFLANQTPTGVRGLLFAAVLAAAVSTLSSSLNASAGVAVKDLLEPLAPQTAAGGGVRFAQAATVLFALLQGAVALGAYLVGTESSVIFLVLSIAGFTTGVLVGLFALGRFRGSCRPAVGMAALGVGFATGVAVFAWNLTQDASQAADWKINGMWNALIASTSTLLAGLVLDAITRDSK